MKIQKILAVLLSLAMMLSLAACSSTPAASEAPAATDAPTAEETAAPEESAETETPVADGEVSMKFTWWGSDVRHEATEKATKLYCEQNNVNIVTEYSAWDGYWEKMAVLAASNSMPDIFQMDAAYINTYIEQNQLADLTDTLDLTGVMDASLIENYKHDGKLYGAPVGANGTGIVYIKSDLAKYGIEEPKEGEERVLVASPKVATYDLQPEMSAPEVTEKLVAAINEDRADFYIVNFANCDMVGHTGVFDAAVKAVEAVDDALSKVVPAILAKGGFALITADHGNADHMFDVASDGSKHPFTAHTTNRVPFIIVDEKAKLTGIEDGRLSDIAPTMLTMAGIEPSAEMTGRVLATEA